MNDNDIDDRWKLLNREAGLVSGLFAGGLYSLKSIAKGDSFYYEAFYSLSLGIERALKLILIVRNPKVNLKSFNHNILRLLAEANIFYPDESVEQKLVSFLNDFANTNRYSMLDLLSSGREDELLSEPVAVFSNNVALLILERHPFNEFKYFIDASFISLVHIEEDFSINSDPSQILAISQKKQHLAKYSAMYLGRIIQPLLKALDELSGPRHGTPYFYEHFTYLKGDDNYFKKRKTFRSS